MSNQTERVEPDVVRQRHEFRQYDSNAKLCLQPVWRAVGDDGLLETCGQPREAECHIVGNESLKEFINSQVDLDPIAEKALDEVIRDTTSADDPYYGQPDAAQESVPERIEFEVRDGEKVSLVNVPKAIWLQTGFAVMDAVGGDEIDFNEINHEDLTWCQDGIEHGDIKFVRSDIANAEVERLRASERLAAHTIVEQEILLVEAQREIASLKAAGITVESALAELRELSPEPHLGRVFVTQKFCYSTEDEGSFEIWNIDGGLFGDVPIVGRTLAEAMQRVREFAAEKEGK